MKYLLRIVLAILVFSFFSCQNPVLEGPIEVTIQDEPVEVTILEPAIGPQLMVEFADRPGFQLPNNSNTQWIFNTISTTYGFRTIYIMNTGDTDITFDEAPSIPSPVGGEDCGIFIEVSGIQALDVLKPKEYREIILRLSVFGPTGTEGEEDYTLTLHTSDATVGDFNLVINAILASY
ncbi:MAG: hypothetical protein KKI09_15065 [Spirochaetes bacterium]|nr:hypothetical protein [Spirochaetota bacterium]